MSRDSEPFDSSPASLPGKTHEGQVRWKPSPADIHRLLDEHRLWLESEGRSGTRAELFFADLNDTDLHRRDLKKGVFWETTFHGTDLRDTDLSQTEGILARNLFASNLAGANLDEKISSFGGLKIVEAHSRIARRLFFFLLLLMVYAWIALASAGDASLLPGSGGMSLPFAGLHIPAFWFFLIMPALIAVCFIAFHLSQQRTWEALTELPAVFPDGSSLGKKAFPWLLNGLLTAHVKYIRERRPLLSRLQNSLSIIAAWVLAPYTLAWFWLRYLPLHDPFLTGVHTFLLSLVTGLSLFFYFLMRRTLRGQSLGGRGLPLRLAWFGILLLIISSISYSLLAIGDKQTPNPIPFIAALAERLGYNPVPDFSYSDISSRPGDFSGSPEDLLKVRGGNLAGQNLIGLNARRAFLAKSDLRRANLQNAVFDSADLRYADLSGANLTEASLAGADLEGARMEDVSLAQANLAGANLQGVRGLTVEILFSARNWLQARFDRAVLDSLGLPADHNERLIRRDLSHCDLQKANFRDISLIGFNLAGANLQGADLEGALLENANLLMTDFRQAGGINPVQIKKARNWILGLYDGDLLQQLGLPGDHCNRVVRRDFRDYNLQEVDLSGIDMKGANLRKVNLKKAILRDVSFQDADLYSANLTGADLTGADFRGAILLDTDLRGAIMSQVKNLSPDQLRWAVIDPTTILPDYLQGYAPEKPVLE